MGRGNYCPSGECADQWYVDYDNYRYDEDEDEHYEGIDYEELMLDMEQVLEAIKKRFPSFRDDVKWGDGYWGEEYRLSNKLFRIGTADNQWSAVLFIQMRQDLWIEQETLAKRHLPEYSKAILQIMLETFGEISIRSGAWCSRTVRLGEEVSA